MAARKIEARIRAEESTPEEATRVVRAFRRNTRWIRSIFEPDPAGWTRWNRKRLKSIVADADRQVQALNDRFTDPSGKKVVTAQPVKAVEPPEEEAPVVTGEVITTRSSA